MNSLLESDIDLLKSLWGDLRVNQDELEKALGKAGLVLVQRQVSRNGRTWNQGFWVDPSDVKETDQVMRRLDGDKKSGPITTPSKALAKVYDFRSGERIPIATNVFVKKEIEDIAGPRRKNKPIRDERYLLKDYGGRKGQWRKISQMMVLEVGGQYKQAEVHYYFEPTVGYVEPKVKFWKEKRA